jgi:hypothetical protein
VGGSPSVHETPPQFIATTTAGLPGAAITLQFELVTAYITVGSAVIAQGGAAVGNPLFEDLA